MSAAITPFAPSARERTINFVLFQAGWFACVLAAARDLSAAGTLAAAGIVAFHILRATRPLRSAAFILGVGVLGVLWDSTLAAMGWVSYQSGVLIPGTAPVWIAALWALFATTLNSSLAWLQGRPGLAAVFGALGGPLSYWAGERMGALRLESPVAALTQFAVGWAVFMLVLTKTARRAELGQS